jgi:hypothetical protein
MSELVTKRAYHASVQLRALVDLSRMGERDIISRYGTPPNPHPSHGPLHDWMARRGWVESAYVNEDGTCGCYKPGSDVYDPNNFGRL